MGRWDTRKLRKKILALSQSEAYKLGIGESTLHYLREKAWQDQRSFRVYSKVRKILVPQSTFNRLERQRRKKRRKGREVRRG